MPFDKLLKNADVGRRLKTIQEIQDVETNFVDSNYRENILRMFGVKDGSIYKATPEQLGRYQAYITKIKYPDATGSEAWLLEERAQNALYKSDIKDISDKKRIALLLGGESHSVLKAVGLKDLANKLLRHSSEESRFIAKWSAFERKAESLMGQAFGGTIENPLQLRKFISNQRDGLVMLDAPRYAERLNTGTLTRVQRKFMRKAVKDDYVIMKDGEYVQNSKYKNNAIAGMNQNTPQGKVAIEWYNLTREYKIGLEDAIRDLFKSDVEYKQFMKDNPINWIEKNVYMGRFLTKEAMDIIGTNRGGKHQKRFIDATAVKIAKDMAVREHGPGATAEQINKFMDNARGLAEEALMNTLAFSQGKIANANQLKTRGAKLPEFIKIGRKKIKIYEDSYENTVKRYALGVSKLIANITELPDMVDYVKRGKINNISGNQAKWGTNRLLQGLKGNKKLGPFVKDTVERQMGINETAEGLTADLGGGAEKLATMFAKTALGFPLAGGKNFIYGQTMSVSTWKLRDYFRGSLRGFDGKWREYARKTGFQELGLRHIETLKTQSIFDWAFSWGGMKPTENVNRYIDIASSRYDTARLTRTIQNKNPNTRKYKKAITRLKDFYFLEDSQINLLKKYGEFGVSDYNFSSSFEKAKVARDLRKIDQQFRHYAHVNAQGASAALFQPSWASGKLARPFTLFQRMAYASSANKVRNFKLAAKNGDYLKMMLMGAGPVMGGTAIAGMYHWMLNNPMPKENSDFKHWAAHMFMEGEGLGWVTSAVRFLDGESAKYTIYPALNGWAMAWVDLFRLPIYGRKTWDQSVDDFLRSTSAGYRGYIDAIANRKTQYYQNHLRLGGIWSDFKNEIVPNQVEKKDDIERRGVTSPPLDDFREVFKNGTSEEIAKQYVQSHFQLAAIILQKNINVDLRPLHKDPWTNAMLTAEETLSGVIKNLDPNPIRLVGKLSGTEEKNLRDWTEYISKDPQKKKEIAQLILNLGDEYGKKVMSIHQYMTSVNEISELYKDPKVKKAIKKSTRYQAYILNKSK